MGNTFRQKGFWIGSRRHVSSSGPVKELFQDPGVGATAWGDHRPLYVFFRPALINPTAKGKNLGNEALIFHEALHGFTRLGDNDLLLRFNKPAPSCNINEYVIEHVLSLASGLDPAVLSPPCPKPQ